jgi:hypothetical protein
MNEEAMRTVYKSIATYRLERDAWRTAYYELVDTSNQFAEEQQVILNSVKRSLDEERTAFKIAIRKARAPGWGPFVGIGYGGGGIEAVIGFGYVWRIF